MVKNIENKKNRVNVEHLIRNKPSVYRRAERL
jgi:hypothetical protein